MSDGYAIRGRVWKRRAAGPRVGILYLHGIQSHGGWFEHSASILNEQGFAVLLPDRRGSGLNRAARGDAPSADRWLDDLDELAAHFVARFNLERVAVLGVSWGGKLALAWLLRRPSRVTHALLVTPGLVPAVDVGLWTRFRIIAALLASPTARFGVPLDDAALFTDNPAGQAFIRSDAAKLNEVTARFLYFSRELDRRLARAPNHSVSCITTVLFATRERIIDPAATLARAQRLVGGDLSVHHIPDSSHTLEFDPDPAHYHTLLGAWLAKIAGNPSQT